MSACINKFTFFIQEKNVIKIFYKVIFFSKTEWTVINLCSTFYLCSYRSIDGVWCSCIFQRSDVFGQLCAFNILFVIEILVVVPEHFFKRSLCYPKIKLMTFLCLAVDIHFTLRFRCPYLQCCIKAPIWLSTIIVTLHIMERFVTDYSVKSIPIPPKHQYKIQLISKTEKVSKKRIR